jgi:4-aminobutyrate aminotransferase-like enzyme
MVAAYNLAPGGSVPLVGPIGTAIEIAPPLTSTRDDLDRVARVMDQAIGEIERERNLA